MNGRIFPRFFHASTHLVHTLLPTTSHPLPTHTSYTPPPTRTSYTHLDPNDYTHLLLHAPPTTTLTTPNDDQSGVITGPGVPVVDVNGVFCGYAASDFVGPPKAVAEIGYALWGKVQWRDETEMGNRDGEIDMDTPLDTIPLLPSLTPYLYAPLHTYACPYAPLLHTSSHQGEHAGPCAVP